MNAKAMREQIAQLFLKRAAANAREAEWVDRKPANAAAHRQADAERDAWMIRQIPVTPTPSQIDAGWHKRAREFVERARAYQLEDQIQDNLLEGALQLLLEAPHTDAAAMREACARELETRLSLLHQQHEVIDIGREADIYEICIEAIRALPLTAAPLQGGTL